MRNSSTEALLFDLGGVVFAVNFDNVFAHWGAHAGLPAEIIKSRYCMDEWYARHERGEVTAEEYFDALRATLGIAISDAQFASGWNAIFEAEIEGVSELFAPLGERVPIYAFSNSNVLHQRCWEKKYARTLGLFRKVFVSCDLGLRKPEAAAYRQVAASIGIEPGRVLFFDDTLENVEGARSIGMPAVHVRGVADIQQRAREFLKY